MSSYRRTFVMECITVCQDSIPVSYWGWVTLTLLVQFVWVGAGSEFICSCARVDELEGTLLDKFIDTGTLSVGRTESTRLTDRQTPRRTVFVTVFHSISWYFISHLQPDGHTISGICRRPQGLKTLSDDRSASESTTDLTI